MLAGRCFSGLQQTGDIKSHFQIPGTMLEIMGFAPLGDEQRSTLRDAGDGDGTYLHEIFGERARWLRVDSACGY